MNKKADFLGVLSVIFLLLILIVVIFEVVLFIYAYIHADEVECNLIWCTFKTTKRNITKNTICSLNNEEINCSNVDIEVMNKLYDEYSDWRP